RKRSAQAPASGSALRPSRVPSSGGRAAGGDSTLGAVRVAKLSERGTLTRGGPPRFPAFFARLAPKVWSSEGTMKSAAEMQAISPLIANHPNDCSDWLSEKRSDP